MVKIGVFFQFQKCVMYLVLRYMYQFDKDVYVDYNDILWYIII